MGKPTGFLEFERELPGKRGPRERVKDFSEVEGPASDELTAKQASRCMDCGIPFCHHGCPLGNNIPEFNDAAYQGNWKLAYEILTSTNNFPEFTGRICPAPCEASCVLSIHKPAVTIEYIEKAIIEKAFSEGIVLPRPSQRQTGKSVAIVGSGPAGLAAASQLKNAGHLVTVFEKDDAVGGLLRYGIPDFKLDKRILDRRLVIMEAEGVTFKTGVNVGVDFSISQLLEAFDAVLLCGGAGVPRDLPVRGRSLKGIHFAMDYLVQQNRRVSGKVIQGNEISASNKHVVVIGGGDTGSDCIGTSNRQAARSITQFEILARPPIERTTDMPWPSWPMILRTSSSHEEGCDRQWSVVTKEFIGDDQRNLSAIRLADIQWQGNSFAEVSGSERIIPCELALLAMGFVHPHHDGALSQLGVELDERGNVKCQRFQTSVSGVFSAGDMRRGQSLVVWAISEGREAARAVDEFLMNTSVLEEKTKGAMQLRR